MSTSDLTLADGSTGKTLPLHLAVEALLFLADEPLALQALAAATGATLREVRAALEQLRADYDGEQGAPARAFELREVGGGWRLTLRREFDDIAAGFVVAKQPPRLSQAALETLTVIAYKQPVTRQQVAAIRAVNVDSVVRTLVARDLIEEVGRDELTGATLYATTDVLLGHLGIASLDELPRISPLLDDAGDAASWTGIDSA